MIKYNGRPRSDLEKTLSNVIITISLGSKDHNIKKFKGCLFVYDEKFEKYFNQLYLSLDSWLEYRPK